MEDDKEAEAVAATSSVTSWVHLPFDIEFNILSRLSIFDSARLILVCKSWLRLISTQRFAHALLSRDAQLLNSSNRVSILVSKNDLESNPCHYLAFSVAQDGFTSLIHHRPINLASLLSDMSDLCYSDVRYRSSCNGMILFSVYRILNSSSKCCMSVHVCNPLTRACTMLPYFPPVDGVWMSVLYPVWALYCQDDSHGDVKCYKVFVVRRKTRFADGKFLNREELLVCTLGHPHSSWRAIEIHTEYASVGGGAVVGNRLYWLAEKLPEETGIRLSLDLSKEEGTVRHESELLQRCPSMEKCFDIPFKWKHCETVEILPSMMGCESLTKKHVIRMDAVLSVVPRVLRLLVSVRPIATISNGNKLILHIFDEGLFGESLSVHVVLCYDLQSHQVTVLRMSELGDNYFLPITQAGYTQAHIDSLVSWADRDSLEQAAQD